MAMRSYGLSGVMTSKSMLGKGLNFPAALTTFFSSLPLFDVSSVTELIRLAWFLSDCRRHSFFFMGVAGRG